MVVMRGCSNQARLEESIMRKSYQAPVLRSQRLELGVFGDYGQDGNDVPPQPPRVDGFEAHMQ
jgi:hypothetical protein